MASACRAWRRPVKAASREARARDARPPLPDGAGPAPWRQAGDVVGDAYSSLGTLNRPNPYCLPKLPLDAADIAHDGGDALADPLAKNWLPRHQLSIDAVIDHGEAVARQLGRADMLLPTRGQSLCAPDRDQFLRQPDTAVIRTGSVAIFTRFCLRRSIASHGTIAKLVGAAGAARSAAQYL
jgi:hypothetical protein